MAARKTDPFVLIVPKPEHAGSGVIRISPARYLQLLDIKQRTGLPIGNIADQCFDFALQRLVIRKEDDDADA